jgi:hypothetical protein
MTLGRGWTSASALLLAGALFAAPAVGLAQQGDGAAAARPEAPLDPASESYKLHMSNGVKLFQDKNFAAAIVEFQAAYNARPKASPLINIALCHKGLFQYPKAVAALRAALDKHSAAMDPADKKAAEDAIAEMSALLAHVTVRVSPDHAVVSIDGEDQPPGALQRPIPLGPGPHRFAARASGHTGAEASLSVASGDKNQVVTLELVPDKGFVRVLAPDGKTAIAIDQKPVGRGSWEGYVAPGRHVVQVYKTGGSSAFIETLVTAGKAQEIFPVDEETLKVIAISPVRYFGKPAGDASIDAPPELAFGAGNAGDKAGPKVVKKDAPLKGTYGHLTATAFSLVAGGPLIQNAEVGGWAIGVRGGYRLSTAFGIELMADYSYLGANEDILEGGEGRVFSGDAGEGYLLESLRFGGNLRFMTPGYRARFVAALGLGLTVDDGSLLLISSDENEGSYAEAEATNVYFNLEQGVEFNIRHVLLGLVVQQVAGTTGRFTEPSQFGGGQITLGFGLRLGYGSW